MDKTSIVKNNADGPAIGNSKQPFIRTMTEDIETLKHDLPKTKPVPKNLPPKGLPIDPVAAPAPVAKKPQTLNEPPFVPFAGRQKPETAPQKSGAPVLQKPAFVRPENNLPPIARLARQGSPSGANLMPKEEKAPAYRPDSRQFQPSAPIQKNRAPLAFKKILMAGVAVAFAVSAYYFLKPASNNPPVAPPPPAEIPPSLVADAKSAAVSANLDSRLMLGVRKYLEDNKNSADIYGASRLIIKNTAGTEILKIENLKDFLGINLPAGFLETVDKNYTLLAFDYPENNYLRLGLVFKIAKPEIISREASSWEPAMFGDLQPLFLGAPALYDPAKNFGSNAYLGASVKYLPLGAEKTALNYAIDKNKTLFMVATSKEDIYYLIEKTAKNQ